jgi:hypothetical protein
VFSFVPILYSASFPQSICDLLLICYHVFHLDSKFPEDWFMLDLFLDSQYSACHKWRVISVYLWKE